VDAAPPASCPTVLGASAWSARLPDVRDAVLRVPVGVSFGTTTAHSRSVPESRAALARDGGSRRTPLVRAAANAATEHGLAVIEPALRDRDRVVVLAALDALAAADGAGVVPPDVLDAVFDDAAASKYDSAPNGTVVVPTYRCGKDDQALRIVQDVFPERNVVGIDSTDIIWGLGSFHCLSQQEPYV
jgi:hypothetical protein